MTEKSPLVPPMSGLGVQYVALCPKCGNDGVWRGPRYVAGDEGAESLMFWCAHCKFARHFVPLDARK